MKEEVRNEILRRMEVLRLSRQCINAFKKGIVWESEGFGALYECNDEEKKLIEEFEAEHKGAKVYHMIHNKFEFGECCSMLYVDEEKSEWSYFDEDLKDNYTFAYVKNIDDEFCSEFGSIGIKPIFGGIMRVA